MNEHDRMLYALVYIKKNRIQAQRLRTQSTARQARKKEGERERKKSRTFKTIINNNNNNALN